MSFWDYMYKVQHDKLEFFKHYWWLEFLVIFGCILIGHLFDRRR